MLYLTNNYYSWNDFVPNEKGSWWQRLLNYFNFSITGVIIKDNKILHKTATAMLREWIQKKEDEMKKRHKRMRMTINKSW